MKTSAAVVSQGIAVFFGLSTLLFLLRGVSASWDGRPVRGWERVQVDFPPMLTQGTPRPLPRLPVAFEQAPKVPPVGLAPAGWENLALGKPVASSDSWPIIGSPALVTDGEKTPTEGYYVEVMPGTQWVQLDLGEESMIYVVWLWHRSSRDGLAYHDVVVEISNDVAFTKGVNQVFNNDYDNSSGRGVGVDRPYLESEFGKAIQINGVAGRYVRFYSKGSSWNDANHYTEIEVYGVQRPGFRMQPAVPTDPVRPTRSSWAEWAKLIKLP